MHVGSEETSTPPRPREEIQQDLRSLEGKRKALEEKHQPLTDQLNVLPEDKLNILRGLWSSDFKGLTSDQQDQIEREFPQLAEPLISMFTETGHFIQEKEQLEAEDLHYALAEYREITSDLSARVNYKAFLEGYFPNGERATGQFFQTLRQAYLLRIGQYHCFQADPRSLNYGNVTSQIYDLRKMAQDWESLGFLKPQPDPHFQIESSFSSDASVLRQCLVETLEFNRAEVDAYINLRQIYKRRIPSPRGFPSPSELGELDEWKEILEKRTEPLGAWDDKDALEKAGFDPQLLAALKDHLDDLINLRGATGILLPTPKASRLIQERVNNLDTEAVYESIAISLPPQTEGMVQVITIDEIKKLLRKVPADLVKGVREITFFSKEPEEKSIESTGLGIIGVCKSIIEDGNLAGCRLEIYDGLLNLPQANDSEIVRQMMKGVTVLTIAHEVGESVMLDLTLEEMQGWEEVLSKDQIGMTAYVLASRRKHPNLGKREDFCESFAIWVNQPAVLMAFSPERARYMHYLFFDHLPQSQKQQYELSVNTQIVTLLTAWKNLGYDEEVLRKMYLPQEEKDEKV